MLSLPDSSEYRANLHERGLFFAKRRANEINHSNLSVRMMHTVVRCVLECVRCSRLLFSPVKNSPLAKPQALELNGESSGAEVRMSHAYLMLSHVSLCSIRHASW